MKTNNYSELEKKVIKKGLKAFRHELEKASIPMLKVLRKYGVTSEHELLKKIHLSYPYSGNFFDHKAVRIPNDSELDSIKDKILDNFMDKVTGLKDRIEDLEI